MLDLLSPLRGYIAQNLQFYLSKYIEDIQLEGLGLFGGDLVLNDLEIKRHVLRESLEIPSSFDFSRGFIRELRIHIPWTQLLSQPIEVKLYTIELILTAKSSDDQAKPKAAAAATRGTGPDADPPPPPPEDKIEQPKSGWINDTLQKILANVSVQVNNLVLKYEHDDVVFSIALGTLDFYSASERDGWKRSFEKLGGGRRAVCKRIDAKDVTIFLDRYTSDGDASEGSAQDRVRRKVVGYELPVLSRTSASVRAKLQLFPNAAAGRFQDGRRSRPTSPRSPQHQPPPTPNGAQDDDNIVDVDGLFGYRPSVMCDPFYYYSCNRSSLTPMYEVDVFIGELLFSVSDRQLEMLNQLIKSASSKIDQAHELTPQAKHPRDESGRGTKAGPVRVASAPAVIPRKNPSEDQRIDDAAKKRESWFGWAMNALGTAEDEEEDELVSELLAETRGALLKVQPPVSNADEDALIASGPVTKTSCVRLCISSASLTLRKHEKLEQEADHQDAAAAENEEELVPVANFGMVKVSRQTRRRKTARPAVPVLNLTMSYVALEMLLATGEEKSGSDLVFEIEKVELVSATASENRDDSKCKKGKELLTWGSIDSSHFSDCVSHPYFINSFFGEETTRLNQRETRSFEIVKVSLDAGIPVWKTLGLSEDNSNQSREVPCDCATTWNGETIRCIPIDEVSKICQQATRIIGIKERVLDGGILSNAVSTVWASNNFPVSISEGILRALTSVADDYRAHRNPDIGAQDNLTQLLEPQLNALFLRYTMHSCSAASLRASTWSANIRHRSVHSALRLRLASTSTWVDDDEMSPNTDVRKEAVSKVLDISFGEAEAVLDPPKCVEILEAVSIILQKKEGDCEAENEVSAATSENAPPSIQFMVQSDIKLVTVSNVRIHLPGVREKSLQGDEEISVRSGATLTGRDFVWLGSYYPGGSKSRLQLGVVSANLEAQGTVTTPLAEVLGFELLVTANSTDGGDSDGQFVSLDKVMIDVSSSKIEAVANVVGGIASLLGYPITWNGGSKMSKNVFRIEVCKAALSRSVSHRPRLAMAQHQSISGVIASISACITKMPGRHCILQGGAAPITLRDENSVSPLFKCDIKQDKSSGVLREVPLLGTLPIFLLNPGYLTATCSQCLFVVDVQLAPLYVELKSLFHLVTVVLSLVDGITMNLPVRERSSSSPAGGAVEAAWNGTWTRWGLVLHVKASGAEIIVNEALQLSIPSVSISSLETEPNPPKQVQPGGALKLECRVESTRMCVSERGVLKGLLDPMLFGIGGVRMSVDLLHQPGDREQSYAMDVSVHISGVQTSLSRLKLLYLSKLPFVETETPMRRHPGRASSTAKPVIENTPSSRHRWHLRFGAQVEQVGLEIASDIMDGANRGGRSIRVVVRGEVSNICVATRFGNHHPTKSHLEARGRHIFTDIQASVGDVCVVERLRPSRRKARGKFGVFSRLPEHAFLGILVCLDLDDLLCVSKSLHVPSPSAPDSESLPSAMLSWHLTSNIAKAFQKTVIEWRRLEDDEQLRFAEIPLVASANDSESAKPAHLYPQLSAFYRNYNEAGLPHHVIAGSMENADVALTTSSLYCIASVLKLGADVTEQRSLPSATDTVDQMPADPGSHVAARGVSLANIEASLFLGQIRLILPSEELMNAVLMERSELTGNVFVVLESLSMASAVRNDISLDGLGYPPFNSRVLPRRSTVQAQRFGQSQLRLGGRVGKISGHVATLLFNHTGPRAPSELGPFEEHLGRTAGRTAQFSTVGTFWSPFNVTCSIEEEPTSNNEGVTSGLKTSTTVALTKLRLDLPKATLDVLVNRAVGVLRGVGAISRAVAAPVQAKLKPVELIPPTEVTTQNRTNQREISFSCDGIEVNMLEAGASTHVRVGSIIIAHNFWLLGGSASIQNLVVGHRAADVPRSPTQKTAASEEVVFGANAEPSLWQLTVENYPEKMIAARWNFGERSEGTLFLDVQAYQLHVSHHFIAALSRFTQISPDLSFSPCSPDKQSKERSARLPKRHPFVFQSRWNVKLLVAPSVISYWRRNPTNSGASGVWMTSGQIFASAGLGSDGSAQQSLRTPGQEVNEINRFVAVPTLEMMLNVDKFGINTSDDLPPLEVHFRRSSIGPTSAHTGSTWQRFSKHISTVSEAQRLLHDCSIRVTGDQQQMVERVALGEMGVCLLHTDIARTSIQAELNALCVKLSSFSLAAVQSLLAIGGDSDKVSADADKLPGGVERSARAAETAITRSSATESITCRSADDFKSLRRMAEGRRPAPGELVFTETLLIETQSAPSPISGAKAHIQIEPNTYDIELDDVAAYLEDCNGPWVIEEHDSNVEGSDLPGLGNKTHSWMGMRWCYHLPRSVHKIVADPVPIPPTGVPSGWPSWSWDQNAESDVKRLCDILCQLRCWDSKKGCYVLVCEFYVPWERSLGNGGLDDADESYEPGSFGELMSQWFDDDMEQTRYRAKLLDFGSRTRTFSFDTPPSSDNWELRWRSPLQSEQDPENKQKRLVVNALLASSLQVNSILDSDAYQRMVAAVTLPQATLSVTHVGASNDSHDIITTELSDTTLSCAVSGGTSRSRMLNLRVSSAIQVYLDNMAQLLTVSVIPRTTIDAMIVTSTKGLEISTLVGPVSVYLNQTSMLVLSAIPKILRPAPKLIEAEPDDNFSSMRIKLVNLTGGDIWYRQEGTTESLLLTAQASAAYSWLSLANSPFYQLRFAIEDPTKAARREFAKDKQQVGGEQARNDDPRWCDPCRIKDNSVTGRYFGSHGFLWICVELKGLQTIVTLRSPLTFSNFCDFPVRVRVHGDVHECARSDELYQDTRAVKQNGKSHSTCISLDGASCTLPASTSNKGNVSRLMVESVSSLEFGIQGGSWCSVSKHDNIPNEFDLVRISDGQLDGSKKSQCSFVVLQPGDADETTHYAWVKVGRAQCRAVLPTDFDPLQPQVSRRYTWMDVSLWPALTVENSMDIPVSFSFSQKATSVSLDVHPSSERNLSALNPFEPVDVQLLYEDHQGSATEPLTFSVVCSTPGAEPKEQIFDLGECRVVATASNDHRPMVRIRTERVLSVANMTPSALHINIGSSLRQQGAIEKVASCEERSVAFSVVSNRLVVSVADNEAPSESGDHMEWSPEITLNVNGDTKPIVVPPGRTGLRSLASAYCVELANCDGYLKLTIRPQVVVINSTNCGLKFAPTDGRGNSLAAEDELSMLPGDDAGWSVPVCVHKEAKKRSITADVSSWLSSKLSRRPSEDSSNPAKQALVARLSCSFRVSLAEDGYEWTEEIAVLLPKIPLLLNSDGKLTIVEPQTPSTAPPNTPESLYPAPSTTTHRRRLLIRHRGFRHNMLTYTMTQTHKSIHIMLFVDHQPPVIVHNQWDNVLGFRSVSFPSDPEGVGSNYYLEYDWGLQVSTKQRTLKEEPTDGTESDTKLLRDWLEASVQTADRVNMPDSTNGKRMRFQIGSPQYGWSNALWQVGGIQFASFSDEDGTGKAGPTFLVMCFYRAGSWLISITCLEDPMHEGHSAGVPSLVLPSVATPTKVEQAAPAFLKLGVVVEELSLHFCDEHDPVRDARGLILYPEILRATCNAVSIVFATAPDPPEVSRHSKRLGYLSHVRSYTTLFVGVEDIEVGHFLQTCNFPVMLCFPGTHASKDLLQFDRVTKHEKLVNLMGKLLDKQLPGADSSSLVTRVIYTDTWDPVGIPSYFHSIELKLAPAVLQVEDDILTYVNAFIRPMLDALEGDAASRGAVSKPRTPNESAWSTAAFESAVITKQRKVYIERLEISYLQVTITARVSIPVLNSFDGTPLHFGSTEMREVFSFPDQLYKDLAADYVADTIVRSPMLLMSLNIIGNPAGFLRSFGQGVRDLVEIPLAASRNGYSPWVLTKGVVGGVASFLGHATAATLTSVSGFSYSISRTMDQLTLPSDQLKKRHYTRPTQLSSALASGLGSLGSSVVGAAAGVITTPIAVYKERQMQGLDTGLRSVVGGVGMGLVGIVARPMGGVASLVSMTSDGLLYGMGGNRAPFHDSVSRFDARPNELLRYKLKVLPDAIGSSLVFAHGVWVVGAENKLVASGQDLNVMSEDQFQAPENEALRSLLLQADAVLRLVQVTVVCSNECLYVVGVSGAQNLAVLVRTSLESIQAVEESLKEPTIFDLGIKTPSSVEWLRFRLPPRQRRNLSHQLRLWLANDAIL